MHGTLIESLACPMPTHTVSVIHITFFFLRLLNKQILRNNTERSYACSSHSIQHYADNASYENDGY